jgi:hypothetical protein
MNLSNAGSLALDTSIRLERTLSLDDGCEDELHNFLCIQVSKCIENINAHEQELPDSHIGHKSSSLTFKPRFLFEGESNKEWLSTPSKSNSQTATFHLLTGLTEGRRLRLEG